MSAEIPLWVQWLVGLFLVVGSSFALIGTIGLLRLKSFYQRVHAPTLGSTLGTWLTVGASMLFFSFLQHRPVLLELLLGVFLYLTAPVTSILLVRAAIVRERRASMARHEDVPTGYTDPEHPEEERRPGLPAGEAAEGQASLQHPAR